MDNKLSAPSRTMHWVDRNKIKPNDYNPNKVSRQNLELLTQSIFTNGWTLPIVVRPDGTIIDGFHRWTVAGPDWKYVPPSEEDDRRTLYERLEGKVLVVIVDHKDKAKNIYGTVTHNRARGTHLLEPMKKISAEERLPGDMYNMQTTMENKDNMIARLEKELSTVQSKKTKAIEALAKLRLEKQKIAGESKGNEVVRAWAEAVVKAREGENKDG